MILNSIGEKWEDGKILEPGNGKVYTASIWLLNNEQLKVRGFIDPFFRTQIIKLFKSTFHNRRSMKSLKLEKFEWTEHSNNLLKLCVF
jgi:hypothetical protein